MIRRVLSRMLWLVRAGVFALGIAALGWVALAFTEIPWTVYTRMASDLPGQNNLVPEVLVVMGGGGVPSESGLMRTYAGAQYAARYPEASVVVAAPSADEDQTGDRMVNELVMRGVDRTRILRETRGRNTREQAVELRAMFGDPPPTVGMITSPEHIRRCLLAFRTAGFPAIMACPAWEEHMQVDLTYPSSEVAAAAGKAAWNPVGGNLLIRYKVWDRLVLQAKLVREGAALLYYRWMGWI